MTNHLRGAWNFPTRVVTGVGRIAELADLARANGIQAPLVVTDKGLLDLPLIPRIMKLLADAGPKAGSVRGCQRRIRPKPIFWPGSKPTKRGS